MLGQCQPLQAILRRAKPRVALDVIDIPHGTLCLAVRFLCKAKRETSTMAVIIDKGGNGGGGGGMGIMGFILGAVMLAVAVVGFLMWDNYKSGGAPKAVVVTGQSK